MSRHYSGTEAPSARYRFLGVVASPLTPKASSPIEKHFASNYAAH